MQDGELPPRRRQQPHDGEDRQGKRQHHPQRPREAAQCDHEQQHDGGESGECQSQRCREVARVEPVGFPLQIEHRGVRGGVGRDRSAQLRNGRARQVP